MNFTLFASIDNGFTQNDMAVMLGVSRHTVENRMAEFNLTNENRFSDIDDSSLDAYTDPVGRRLRRINAIRRRVYSVCSPLSLAHGWKS